MQAGFDGATQVHHVIYGFNVELVGAFQFGMLSQQLLHVGANVRITATSAPPAFFVRVVLSTGAQRASQQKSGNPSGRPGGSFYIRARAADASLWHSASSLSTEISDDRWRSILGFGARSCRDT